MLHCLIDKNNEMTKDEFKKFWEMIPKANESTVTVDTLYGAFTTGSDVSQNIIEGLAKNGIVNLARTTRQGSG